VFVKVTPMAMALCLTEALTTGRGTEQKRFGIRDCRA